MSKSVFISHAVKDSKIAEQIVDLLEGGIGVPESEIFCSSLEGYGIPTGENFVTYIKDQIAEPQVVILLLTPSYFSSNFCVSELGASWVMSHDIFPVLVPPLSYDDVKDVLLGTQVAKIDNDIKYNELRDCILKKIPCDKKSSTKWDTKRKAFLQAIEPLLKKVSLPEKVSKDKFDHLMSDLEECKEELLEYETEISHLKNYIKEIEILKDAESIKDVKKQFCSSSISEEFEELVKEISKFSSILPSEVFKFVLCDYYSQPYRINYSNHGDDFAEATRYKYIETEGRESVKWSNKKMQELENLLRGVQVMINESDHAEELESYHDETYDVPLEADNQAFWELHYEI